MRKLMHITSDFGRDLDLAMEHLGVSSDALNLESQVPAVDGSLSTQDTMVTFALDDANSYYIVSLATAVPRVV